MTIKQVFEHFNILDRISFATTNDEGYIESRIARFCTYDDEGLYFWTMNANAFYEQLVRTKKVAAFGHIWDSTGKLTHTAELTWDDIEAAAGGGALLNNAASDPGNTPDNIDPTPGSLGSASNSSDSAPDNTDSTSDNTDSTSDNTDSTPDNTDSTPDSTDPALGGTDPASDSTDSTSGNTAPPSEDTDPAPGNPDPAPSGSGGTTSPSGSTALTSNNISALAGTPAAKKEQSLNTEQPHGGAGYTISISGDVRELTAHQVSDKTRAKAEFRLAVMETENYPAARFFMLYAARGEILDYDYEGNHRSYTLLRRPFAFGGMTAAEPGLVIADTCIECGLCLETCTFDAIKEGSPFSIIGTRCEECGSCCIACPVHAIGRKDVS